MLESTSNSERTLKFIVEYDGTGLCGWQRQDNGPTVQQHLEQAISEMLKTPTAVVGASRTDAGVHSVGQTAIFKTDCTIPCFGLRQGLNRLLPDAITLRSVEEVSSDFHPRFDARGKHYCYTVLNRDTPSPLQRRNTWYLSKPLDVDAMSEAAQALCGEHDFSSFRASGCGAKTPHRRIHKISVTRVGELVKIEVWGNAFLRNMVRIIAGTIVDVGRGRISAQQMAEILEAKDRRAARQTAPAQGLCLLEVFYNSNVSQWF
ncbi:MAG: tRNA pseudouridine(38-40) synthase TruA [Kofleriaceae bacterium]|nr:tRNA pseudouridine(38-40) synthase TruA [Kofleriaceae bacterium]